MMNRGEGTCQLRMNRFGKGGFSLALPVVGIFCLCLAVLSSGCRGRERTRASGSNPSSETIKSPNPERTFTEDVAFLRQHVETLVLESGPSRIAVVPAYQGRVMTSTAGGDTDMSFGWLNYEAIQQGVLRGQAAEGKLQAQIHVFGGEERFWLGPEGGQFGIYFAPGAEFEFGAWKTPPSIDTEPFTIESQSENEVVFRERMELVNHSGFRFDFAVQRKVSILDRTEVEQVLNEPLGEEIKAVGYETVNQLTNLGQDAWTRETGALSVWLLGMYKHSPETIVVIPINDSDQEVLGPIVNDEYFGKVPGDRLKHQADVLLFRADGQYRSKIGISPDRSLGIAGSYAAETGTLNLVIYERPQSHDGYVNSMWELQEAPFSGDAINAYNDGAPEPGADPLGPFYELETSSPAAFLAPGESVRHVQQTIHLQGPQEILDRISRRKLRLGLDAIGRSFTAPL